MSYIRKSVVDTFTHEELLQLVKSGLDELGMTYEEKPGGFGPGPMLDPGIFEDELWESLVLEDYITPKFPYCQPKRSYNLLCDQIPVFFENNYQAA